MALIDELLTKNPGYTVPELVDWYAKELNRPIEEVVWALLSGSDVLVNYPYVIFLKFFVEALPAAAIAYGLVWLVMRPKAGARIQRPLLWHTLGVAFTLITSAVFRILAMITFAGRSAYEPAAATGAAGFFMLIVPAIVAVSYFVWLKRNKLSVPNSASEQPAPLVSQSPMASQQGGAIVEEAIYAVIAEELETGTTDRGLWTRLFAECDGDESRTRVSYIKQRAEKLKARELAVRSST